MSEIGEWLANELKTRAWSSSELARRAGISQSSVSNVLTGKQIPGLEFCKGVAQALGMPTDRLLRLAGHLAYVPEEVAEEQEAVRLFRTLNAQMRDVALSVLRALQGGAPHVGAAVPERPRTIVERMAQEIARDLEVLPPDDQRRVIDLMKRLRGDREQRRQAMSRWEQIHRHFPLRALLVGWLYARLLRHRRWLRYLLGNSRRQWCVACSVSPQIRIVE